MDQRERLDSFDEALLSALDGRQAKIWTALPGIVQSFDPSALTCVVQPAIQAQVRSSSGSAQWVNLPLLLDCPVTPMRGGGCTLTFPIAQNDECLVILASRCIDSWWQLGGVQVQAEFRMHDLSDGFAIVGPFSQATKISGWSTSAVQLRSNDGEAYLQLNPSTHEIDAITSGNISANAGGTAKVQSAGTMTLTAPNIVLNGNVQINGNIGQAGSGGPGTAQFTAPITAPDVNLPNGSVNGHYHSDPQGGNTGTMTG